MNKGFTLVELLGIISVLAIFMAVAMPSLIETNKKTIEQQKKTFRSNVSDACVTYLEINPDNYKFVDSDGNNRNIRLTVNDLIEKGYLKKNIVNPYTSDDTESSASDWNIMASNNSGIINCCYAGVSGEECECSEKDEECLSSENVIKEDDNA